MSYRESNAANIIHQLFDGGPIQLRWGAWVSDTYLLKRDGWYFSAEEHYDPYHKAQDVSLAVTSPDKHVVIAGHIYVRPIGENSQSHIFGYDSWERKRPVEMKIFKATDVFRTIGIHEMDSWKGMCAVDVTNPVFIKQNDVRLRDFKFFKQLDTQPENAIYIPPNSVDDLFNEILKIQYPQQQEIKKGLIMPEAKPLIKAQIYTLVA